jgi:hypothetical protein
MVLRRILRVFRTPLAGRRAAALALALAMLPQALFLRDNGLQRWDHRHVVMVRPVPVPALPPGQLGPFTLEGVWQLSSRDFLFGGWSALVARPGGRLLAINDRGARMEFTEPPANPGPLVLRRTVPDRREWITIEDAEAATGDPAGNVWVSWEDRRAISRFTPDFAHENRVMPKEIQNWSGQFGGESLARTPDGHFILISEDFLARSYDRGHETLVFPSDPTAGASMNSPGHVTPRRGVLHLPASGYRPTDIALLPDGRALILQRRLLWPLPMRFSGRIAIADPADLARTGQWTARDLAWLDPPLPTDNFEGIAVRPRADGTVDVWVISDDNKASTQRTLLLKLRLDPRRL